MGVSFKLGRVRKRYHREVEEDNEDLDNEPDFGVREGNFTMKEKKSSDHANVSANSGRHFVTEDMEVSFSLNLFADGFCFGEPSKFLNYVPKKLLPYNQATETIFIAIEYGVLPGDLFDNLPCKFTDGTILCEIQDYRNCLHRNGIASANKSPVVHKVLLKMCMEIVIKDIYSVSNDSWSYEDLLTVESLIWKALQPDLHLNPEAREDRLCIEPWTKKLNLGINLGRKRRRLADALATNPTFSCNNDKGVPCSQPTFSSSILNLQKNSGMSETISQPSPFTMGSNHQMVDSFYPSAMVDLTPLNLSPVEMQHFSVHNSLMKETTSSVFSEQATFETHATQRTVFRIPKQEPLDFSQQQPTWSQSDNMLVTERLQKQSNIFSHWKPEAGIVPNERFRGRRRPLLLKNSAQQAVLEGIPKLHAGMPTTVKLEPIETSNLTGLDVKRIGDRYVGMDVRSNRSNLLQLKQHPSPVLGANIPPNSSWDQITYDQNSGKDVATQKRKALQNPWVTAGVSITPLSLHQNGSVQREASISAKRKKKSRPKDVGTYTSDEPAISHHPNAISETRHQHGNPNLPRTSGDKGDLERFLKIDEITRRNGLKKKKCNVEEILPEKRTFSISKFANEFSEVNGTEEIPLSENFADTTVNVAKMRTLRFGYNSLIHQGYDISMIDSKACLKLVMVKRQDEEFVEAGIIYGRQEETVSLLLPTFPCTRHYADQFAKQFTDLMEREGCCVVSESMEPELLNTEDFSRTQLPTVTGAVTQAGREPGQLLPGTFTCQLSNSMLLPMNDSYITGNLRQLPSKTLHSGGHLLHPGNAQSTQQSFGSNPLTLMPNVAPQGVQQQCHQNKQNCPQSQLLHRQREQQLIRKIKMEEDLGAVVGGSSYHVPMGGQLPSIGNMGQFNNIGSSVPSSLNINPHFGGVSDTANAAAPALAKLRAANGQGQTLMLGYQYLRNIGGISSQPPNLQDMAYLLTNQQLQQYRQHGVRSILQPTEVNSIVHQYMGLSQTQVNSMSSLQLSSEVHLRQLNRNMMFAPESSELSTQTHSGSIANSSCGTSSNLPGFSKDKCMYRPHRP